MSLTSVEGLVAVAIDSSCSVLDNLASLHYNVLKSYSKKTVPLQYAVLLVACSMLFYT